MRLRTLYYVFVQSTNTCLEKNFSTHPSLEVNYSTVSQKLLIISLGFFLKKFVFAYIYNPNNVLSTIIRIKSK